LITLERERFVRELHRGVSLRSDELLKVVVVQVLCYATNDAPPAPHFFDADQDVRRSTPPRIGERKYVLEQFTFLVVRRPHEGILVPLEVEGRVFFFVEQALHQLFVHSHYWPPS